MTTLDEGWHVYRTNMLPGNAPDRMVMEARRAFYWGARFVFDTIEQAAAEAVKKSDKWIDADIDAECADKP